MIVVRPFFRALPRAVRGVFDRTRPVLTTMVVTRRCNLACGYCFEYDSVSTPVPTATLLERVDHMAGFGTVVMTLTGGEPLLHPELDRVIAHAVERGIVCTMITNGYALTASWVDRLNKARLTGMQVSVDSLQPNEKTEKSWDKLVRPLQVLRERAKFTVSVNAVLGAAPPEDVRALSRLVQQSGFFMTVGLMHDVKGQCEGGLLGRELGPLYREMQDRSWKRFLRLPGEGWEEKILREGRAAWRCRAGARSLYVDEHGIVSYCSQRRGDPGVPIAEYTRDMRKRAYDVGKGCEASCTQGCVRTASAFDGWRGQRPFAISTERQ